MDNKDLEQLIKVALGEEKADLAIINANLLDVFTGEILENYSVGIKGKRIAYVGNEPEEMTGKGTVIIDAKGKTLIPGLIDGHAHLAWLYNVNEFLKYAMKGGTTAIITETMEIFPVMGYEGVSDFLASLNYQPIKIFATAPAMVSTSQKKFGISVDSIRKLLSREEIVGLGESYWQAVFQKPDSMLPIFQETLNSGKVLEGHSAGAKGRKLAAYAAAGVSSCHEPINVQDVLERLRLGLYVMIREGSIRRDLEAIAPVKDKGINLRRLILVTDGVEPGDLIEKGYMEYVVQKAIDCGFDPVTAIQMATLNVAEHFSLDHLIGGIAPGRYADMLIIPDLNTIKPEYVISNGQVIARGGENLVSPRKHFFSENSRKSIHIHKYLTPEDFTIHVPLPLVQVRDLNQHAEVRVIDMITDLVTKEIIMTIPVADGKIRADTKQDILKVSAIERADSTGKMFTGLIHGFKMKSGAIASSAAWDTSDIIVVGADDADMATAVNRIYDLQGGAVLCNQGKILCEIPLPVFGLISDMPMNTLVERIEKIRSYASELGILFRDPLLTLVALTGAAIPFLRICEEGLIRLKDGKCLNLFVSPE